jgi:imidazolonepropionase-like amidohydrolase
MKRFIAGATLAALAIWLSGPSDVIAAQGEPVLVIQGGTVIDGNGGAPAANTTVIVTGNRITQVGRNLRVPAGAQVIDAAGKFVLPGFIDAKSNHASNFNEAYLIWGVTSAVISGGSGDPGVAEKYAIDRGIVRGPRLFTSFAAINGGMMTPQLAEVAAYSTGIPSRYPYVVQTPEQVRELAAKFFDAGADFISSGEGSQTPEFYKAMVDEAKRRGKASVMRSVGPRTAAQELADIGADVAIHAGQVSIRITTDAAQQKWANYIALPPDAYADMDDAKARVMARYLASRNLALEPDIIAMDRGFLKNWARLQGENAQWYRDYLANPALRAYFPHVQAAGYIENTKSPDTYLDAPALEIRRRGYENKMRFLKMFVDAGGKLLAASDIPQSPPGLGVHQEMAAFVEDVGVTPMQALLSVTGWASDAFKLPDVGRIQPGKFADLLIVDANPMQDILNTRRISMVVKDGKVVDRTYHADALAKSFRIGMLESGNCCFSSPVVEGGAWTNALKTATWNPNSRNGGFQGAGGVDSALSPTPGIEAIMPYVIDEGSAPTQLTVRGFNYVTGSQILVNGNPVPTRVVSRTELQTTLDANVLNNPGRYVIRVRNPAPITGDWGDTSNAAKITVPYRGTPHSKNQF